MHVTVRICQAANGEVVARASTTIGQLGEVVIGSGRNEYQAQWEAARFLDTNYPGEPVTWEGGYHGSRTDGPRFHSTYWNP